MKLTTVYVDENITKLLKDKGINISQEVRLYLAQRAEVFKAEDSKENLELELSELQAKSEAIKNRINQLNKPDKKSEEKESELSI